MFGGEADFNIKMDLFRSDYQKMFPIELDYQQNTYKLFSNRMKLTEFCKVKVFVRENLLVFYVWVLCLLLFVFLLLQEIRIKRNYSIAKNLYKCIVLDIHNNNKVPG